MHLTDITKIATPITLFTGVNIYPVEMFRSEISFLVYILHTEK
jgi:hypothetical protein